MIDPALLTDLKAHLLAQSAPVNALVVAENDAAIAEWYNELAENGPVPLQELRRVATAGGITFALRKADNNVLVVDDLQAAVQEALALIDSGILDPVDVHHVTFTALFDALIAGGILTEAHKTAVLGLAANRRSRISKASDGWSKLVESITPSDAANARLLP